MVALKRESFSSWLKLPKPCWCMYVKPCFPAGLASHAANAISKDCRSMASLAEGDSWPLPVFQHGYKTSPRLQKLMLSWWFTMSRHAAWSASVACSSHSSVESRSWSIIVAGSMVGLNAMLPWAKEESATRKIARTIVDVRRRSTIEKWSATNGAKTGKATPHTHRWWWYIWFVTKSKKTCLSPKKSFRTWIVWDMEARLTRVNHVTAKGCSVCCRHFTYSRMKPTWLLSSPQWIWYYRKTVCRVRSSGSQPGAITPNNVSVGNRHGSPQLHIDRKKCFLSLGYGARR